MLTKFEAEQAVLTRLRTRYEIPDLSIAQFTSSERDFGWAFHFTGGSVDSKVSTLPVTATPRIVIVNKHSGQVVASHVEYELEQFVRLYEKLLSRNQARSAAWCGTLPIPWLLWRKRTVAERAEEAGFYEIRGKEGEP